MEDEDKIKEDIRKDIEMMKREFETKARKWLRDLWPYRGTPEFEEFMKKFMEWYHFTVGVVNFYDRLLGGKGDWMPELPFWLDEYSETEKEKDKSPEKKPDKS